MGLSRAGSVSVPIAATPVIGPTNATSLRASRASAHEYANTIATATIRTDAAFANVTKPQTQNQNPQVDVMIRLV